MRGGAPICTDKLMPGRITLHCNPSQTSNMKEDNNMNHSPSAILLVAHGSSDLSADSTCSDLFYHELHERFPGTPVYQAYSAPITLKRIDRETARTPVCTIDEAVSQILADGASRLNVLAASLNPCKKYSKVVQALEPYQDRFETLTVSTPLLNADADPSALTDVLLAIIEENLAAEGAAEDAKKFSRVLLAAHTHTEEIAALWEPVLDKLQAQCALPVSLIYRNGHPNVDDYLAAGDCGGRTLIIPLMLFGGRHLTIDLAEGENSLVSKLEKAGIPAALSRKGLGEYASIRSLYYKRL